MIIDFKDVVEFLEGPGVRKWQFTTTGIKLINIRNIVNSKIDLSNTNKHLSFEEVDKKYKHFLLEKGDYIIASSGVTWGKIAEIKKEHLPLCLNTSIIKLKPINDDILNKKYLWFFIKSFFFTRQIDRLITGSAQPNFGPSHLKKIKIPLPSLTEQKRIAGILDEADKLRQLNQQLISKYNQLTQSLFLDMFGDPVHNPKDWEVTNFEKTLLKVNKIDKNCKETEIQYIDISSIDNKKNTILKTTKYSLNEKPSRAQQILLKNDILFSTVRPNLKNIAINKVNGYIASTGFFVCRVNQNYLTPSFLLEVLKSDSVTNYFINITSGANYPAVKNSDIKKFNVIIPPIKLQNEFAERIQIIEQQKTQAEEALQKSEDLFNSLLQKAFKGEV